MPAWSLRGAALRLALAFALLVLALQLWYLGWIVFWKWHDPADTAFMRRERERIEQAHAPGAPARRLQRTWVDYAHISPTLKRAVVSAEDGRFVHHAGVDWEAMRKAYDDNRHRGHAARGGSTITQQLAKNLFLSPRRSYLRKAEELVIAAMIEAVWDKRRILEVYLNVVEWGDGVFGAEAGARHHYGVSAAALDAAQASTLAAMLPSPKFFDHHPGSAFLAQRAEGIERLLGSAEIP